ncbi:MAG: NnrS family protein [Candidatus Omnitrophota bacterium]|nr:NnrS family protein [Candidatus Omnitrophota bacterium]
MFNKAIDPVCREPYRLFFPFGVWMGVVGISPWLLYAMGLTKTYSGFFHSSMLTLVYLNCFIIGFLLTFIPRFTGTFYANRAELFSFLFLFIGIAVFLRQEQWAAAQMVYLGWLTLLLVFLMRRIPHRKNEGGKPPMELIWIPVAILHAFVGTMLMLLVHWQIVPPWILKVGRPMMEQGFLMSIVLGIGGFLIPRILGTYQAQSSGGCCGGCACSAKKISATKKAVVFHLICAGVLFASFWLQGLEWTRLSYVFQGMVATAEFLWTRTLPKYPRDAGFYGKLSWVSCWMIVVGLWGAAVFPKYSIEMLHITFIGGFSLMTFAIATMVVLSHGGEAEQLKKPIWVLWVVLGAILFTLFKRLAVIFFPGAFFKMLGIASSAWIIGALVWLIYIFPRLFYIPREDEFQKMHKEAGQQH